MTEQKVVYRDGGTIRCLRGRVVDDGDEYFIEVHRRDGVHKINKAVIIKIEEEG